ncbi:MAG: hypothetical protein ACOYT8_06625 [Candidatus Dependentiae bacterium]
MKLTKYFLITLLCCPFFSKSLDQTTLNTLKTVAGIATVGSSVSGGYYANKLNKAYEKEGKKPDTKMRLLKAGAMIAAATSFEAVNLFNGKEVTKGVIAENIAKLSAFTIASLLATSDKVESFIRTNPLTNPIKGFLVDPQGSRDMGMLARFALAYAPLKTLFINLAKRCNDKK